MKKPPILSRYPRSEPDRATWSFPHQIKLTFGRRSRRLHQYPACGGWGSRGRGHSSKRWLRNFEQGVKWKLGLTAGMFCLRIRSEDEEASPPEPHTGLQGEGGPCCPEKRSKDCTAC